MAGSDAEAERRAGRRSNRPREGRDGSEGLAVSERAGAGTQSPGPLSYVIYGGVFLSFVVLPAVVLGITEFELATRLGLPRVLTLGVLAMIPGVVLGGVAILVMLTPD